MTQNSDKRIISFQALRGFAFIGVFLEHSGIVSAGAWGVSIFFILSGYLLGSNYYEKQLPLTLSGSIDFSRKKVLKLYWLHCCTLALALPFVIVQTFRNFSSLAVLKNSIKVILNLFLTQSWIPIKSIYYSLNGVSWYLSTAAFLYFCFPYIMSIIKRLKTTKSHIICALLIYAFQILVALITVKFCNESNQDFIRWMTYISPIYRIGDLIIGINASLFFKGKKTLNINKLTITCFEILWLLLTVFCIYIFNTQSFGILGTDPFRYTVLYTPGSVIGVLLFSINKGFITNTLCNRIMIGLGNISMITFLIHQLIIRYLKYFTEKLNIYNIWIVALIALFLTIILANALIYMKKKLDNNK